LSSAQPPIGVKKAFLYTLIVSVVLSSVLGVIAILGGTGQWFELKILLTTLTISGASICGLACGALLETRKRLTLPLAGIIFALLGGILLVFAIWAEPKSEDFWKVAASILTLAVAFAHLSLLLRAHLDQRFRWAIYANHVFVMGVASLIISMIIGEPEGEVFWRLLAIGAIGTAAMTVLTPVFHWLSKNKDEERTRPTSDVEIDDEIATLRARIAELERLKHSTH
jgi:hypothetical protein